MVGSEWHRGQETGTRIGGAEKHVGEDRVSHTSMIRTEDVLSGQNAVVWSGLKPHSQDGVPMIRTL